MSIQHEKYEYGTTTVKAIVAILVVCVWGLAPLVVLAEALPADPTDYGKPVVLFGLVVAALRAANNIRKNYRDDGKPLWRWVPFLGIVLCIPLVGCATNTARFVEKLYDETTGNLISTTKFYQAGVVTIGSKQDTASGDMSYTWGGTENKIAITNAAEGQQAGSGAELVEATGNVVIRAIGIRADRDIAERQIRADTVGHGIDAAADIVAPRLGTTPRTGANP